MQASVTIPGRNVKLFAKALSALAKIGNEVVVEFGDGLHLQALNQAHSAFVIFRFAKSFFSSFECGAVAAKVAVAVKNCCAVFRAANSVESCTMSLGNESTLLSFWLRCKGGVTKQSRLVAEQSHVHRAVYDKMTPCRLSARPKLLTEIVGNFGAGVEEVSLVPLATQLQLRTFVDDTAGAGPSGAAGGALRRGEVLQTQLVVESADFESYGIGRAPEAELTVSLKELRAAAAFCESAGQPVAILFSAPGAPLLLSVSVFDQLVVDFVLATMAPPDPSQRASSSQPSPVPAPSSLPPTVGGNSASEKEKEEEDGDNGDNDDDECVEGTPERERKRARAAADFGQ